jgi:FkbM family methyltransferase
MDRREIFMLKSADVTKKLSATYRVFHDEGMSGVTAFLRWRLDFQMQMLAARNIKSVDLDGCTVNVKGLPNTQTKLDLLKKEYEEVERRLVPKYLDPGLPVVELGGCIGVVACITNRLLKNPGRHVVVEANPLVIPFLKETRDGNHCQFEILNEAIAYEQPFVTFGPNLNFCANSLKKKGGAEASVTVPATTLRDIVSKRAFDRFTLICDIEGCECDLVSHEADVLQRAATIVLETHARFIGEDKNAELLKHLEDLGFRIVDQDAFVLVLKQSRDSNLPESSGNYFAAQQSTYLH